MLVFVLLLGLTTAVVFAMILLPIYFYITAILSTIMILGVKVAALFVQGPQMKKLSTRMTASESQYESSLQLLLVISICFETGELSLSSASSLLSSILMIGKSGAESYLTFGKENLLEQTGTGWRGLLNKLKLLGIYSPVFCVTAAFRLTALAVIFNIGALGMIILLPFSLGAPFLLLFFMKLCCLKDLSVVEIGEAALGERRPTLFGADEARREASSYNSS